MSETTASIESQDNGLNPFNYEPSTPYLNQAMKKLGEMKENLLEKNNALAQAGDKKQEEPSDPVDKNSTPSTQDDTKEKKEAELSSAPAEDFKALYEKLQKESEIKEKRAEDNQRHARQIARSVSAVKKHIMELQESGEIDEDIAKSILEVASKNIDLDQMLMPDAKGSKEKLPEYVEGLQTLTSQASEVLEKYLELSPNEGDEKKYAQGFNAHLNLLAEEGRKELYEFLKKHGESPKALLKSMLEIGKNFWESPIGKGLSDHGDLIGIIDHQASKIDALTKQIEKMSKTQKQEEEKNQDFKATLPLKTEQSKINIFNTAEVMKQTAGFGDIIDILGGKV